MSRYFSSRLLIISVIILILVGTFFFVEHAIFTPSPRPSSNGKTHVAATYVATPRVHPTLSPSVSPTPVPSHPLQISTDPYSNATSQHKTEVEPASFAYGSTIIAAFQAGRFFDVGSSNIGWATSIDAGMTWQSGFLPATTIFAAGPYGRITDPTVSYNVAHHIWIIASIAFLNAPGIFASVILVSLSTNGGTVWSKPVIVADVGDVGGLDKDWIVCDNTPISRFYGRCYLEWDNYHRNDLIQMSTSNDGGKTWGGARMTINEASGFSGYPLVQPDGTVIVPISDANQTVIQLFTSTNGGVSWSQPYTLVTFSYFARLTAFHNSIAYTASIDSKGNFYLVWLDCRFEPHCTSNDLVMTTSTDGKEWSAIRRLPLAPVGAGMNYSVLGLGVDGSIGGSAAHLGLAFYYYAANCSNNCALSVGFTSSNNGGATWSPQARLIGSFPLSWAAAGDNSVGDYITVSFSMGKAFPFFAVPAKPENTYRNEAMYTMSAGLVVNP